MRKHSFLASFAIYLLLLLSFPHLQSCGVFWTLENMVHYVQHLSIQRAKQCTYVVVAFPPQNTVLMNLNVMRMDFSYTTLN